MEITLQTFVYNDEQKYIPNEDVKERFETIDFEQAKQDVLPFIADKTKLDLWGKDFFMDITHNLKQNEQ